MKRLLPLTCGALASLAQPVHAQTNGCDTSIHVAIVQELTGTYRYVFNSAIEPGNHLVQGMAWHYYNGTLNEQTGAFCDVVFPEQAEYPVCLTVNAINLATSMSCSTSVCRLIEAQPDVSCESLDADFTIAAIEGQTITFASTSQFGEPLETFWSYGELSASGVPEATQTFSGAGPHKVCMTAVGPPPVYCNTTVCKWLYLGPGNLPCEVVVDHGFVVYQQNNVIVALDTSMTSGMERSVRWAFGDGPSAAGPLVVHRYAMPGTYTVCSAMDVWGPVLADTCSSIACTPPEFGVQVTVPELAPPELLQAWPVPLTDQLSVIAPWPNALLVLVDAQGRLVGRWTLHGSGEQVVDVGDVGPGAYFLECRSKDRALRRTVFKP